MLDSLGVSIAGTRHPASQKVTEMMPGWIDLAQMLPSGEKSIVICPLHAEIFAAASAWRQFEHVVYGLTAEKRSLLIFDTVDAMTVGTDRKLVDTVRNLSFMHGRLYSGTAAW